MIYIVRAQGTDLYKIGFTARQVEERLKEVQTGSPYPLKIIHTFDGSQDDEKRMHLEFKQFLIHGEWFKLNEERLLGLIVNLIFSPDRRITFFNKGEINQENHLQEFVNNFSFSSSRKKLKDVKDGTTEDTIYDLYVEFCRISVVQPMGRKYFMSELAANKIPFTKFYGKRVFHAILKPESGLNYTRGLQKNIDPEDQ